MASHKKFPFSPLPNGEVSPRYEKDKWYELMRRDCQIIRWFVEEEMRLEFRPSPLAELLDLYDKLDANTRASSIEALSTEVAR